MPLVPKARSLLRNWFRRRRVERDLEAEVSAVLDQLTDEKIAAGMSPAEAVRAARIELGGVEQVKRQVREARTGSHLETIWQDVRYGLRGLRRTPVFTAVVVATLALGIGANAAIFGLVNALLLRPLPGARPAELVAIYTSDFSGPLHGASSYPDFLDFRAQSDTLSDLVAHEPTPFSLSSGRDSSAGQSERVFGEAVSANYFSMLGVRPAPGRGFLPEEDRAPGAHPVVVISHGLWHRRFAADPTVIGQRVRLSGRPFTIVGVAPAGFTGLRRGFAADLWVPLTMQAQAVPGAGELTERGNRSLLVMGRLRPGATIEQAQAQFQAIAARLHETHRDQWTDVRDRPRAITLVSEGKARIFPQARGMVLAFMALLMTVVGMVLLIACANVANLLLARASARRKEIAVRLALGAGPARLVRQLFTESLLLALLGGGAGLLVAMWGTHLLMAFKPPTPVPVVLDLPLDWRVLGFTFGVTLLTSVLIGSSPALPATRLDLASALKDDAGGAAGAGFARARLRRMLVVAQVALSLVLLVGSGLFLRSLHNASAIPLGFDPDGVFSMSIDLRLQGYGEARARAFHRQLLEDVRAQPGVVAAGLVTQLPLDLAATRRGITIGGYAAQPGEDTEIHTATVGSDYFEAMRIPLVRGRAFSERDGPGAPRVVIVNQAFARRYWPGQDALGKRIQMGGGPDNTEPHLEVVGVVADGKYVRLSEESVPFFYLPLLQDHQSTAALVVRSAGDRAASLGAVRGAIRRLDPNLPVHDVKTMDQHLSLSLFPTRMAGAVLGVFGLVALALAALGLYGVVSYSVAQRTREIGVRMALGARRRDVIAMIVSQGLRLTSIGLVIGLVIAIAATRLLTGMLHGIGASDPLTFAGVTLLLAAVAALACVVPARRAARVDPMAALRHE